MATPSGRATHVGGAAREHDVTGRLQIEWTLPLRYIAPALAWGTVFFTLMGLLIIVAKFTYQFDRVYGLYSLFELGSDTGIPTWFSSLGLLTCSGLLAVRTSVSCKQSDRWSSYWWALAAIFLLLSVDEVARLHEVLGGFIGAQLRPTVGEAAGFLHYGWVMPGLLFVAVIGLAYARFLFAQPRKFRNRLIACAVVYIGGAVLVEMCNARSAYLYTPHSLIYQLGTVVEECMEMAGIALFARALVLDLDQRLDAVALHLTPDMPA